jgi:hypothetical protein
MSSSNLEARIEKNFKKRSVRSPLSSTAAETLLLLTRQNERPEYDYNLMTNPVTIKKNRSELFKKSFRRTQSTEYLKIISEKNLEIKKILEENHSLSNQVSELSSMVKKYQKLRNLLREKDSTIDTLKGSIERLTSNVLHINKETFLDKKKSVKILKKNSSKLSSRLSLGSEADNYDIAGHRPMTVANRNTVTKSTPSKIKSTQKIQSPPEDLGSLLLKTQVVLQGWKKAYKTKRKLSVGLPH